jgi:serine O-acetyltransferase
VSEPAMRSRLRTDAKRILWRTRRQLVQAKVFCSALADLADHAAELADEDLNAIAHRDAAAKGSPEYVYAAYVSFRAVLAYRVAHLVRELGAGAGGHAGMATLSAARLITETAKVGTGIDIHPAAIIGPRFVLDHGTGTVIGEQVELGADCYVLQNVVLGGRSIGYSSLLTQSRRHPHIGSRVQIGANAMVLGPVTIGDDCMLDPGVRVTTDLQSGSKVRVITTMQVVTADHSPEIHGLALALGELLICGLRLNGCVPVLLDAETNLVDFLPVHSGDDTHIRCGLSEHNRTLGLCLGLAQGTDIVAYVTPNPALRRVRL